MYPQRLFYEAVPLFSIFFALVLLVITLAVRREIVVVNDKYFSTMYGEKREKAQALENSIKTLRRVRIFYVDDSENNDIIAQTITERFENPFCVIFPYRYAQAAVLYADANERISTLILSERNLSRPVTGKALYVPPSTEADYYRAARIAGQLAREPQTKAETEEAAQTVVVITGESLTDDQKNAVENGLRDSRWAGNYSVISLTSGISSENAAAMVLISSAGSFVQMTRETPCVIFSAAPQYLFPAFIKAAVDDSVWSLMPGLVKQAGQPPAVLESSGEKTGHPVPAAIKIFPFRQLPWRLFLALLLNYSF
ncbi:MAG: hypothetical protein LBG74_07080 [Spirochaetaceae bacterium]|jgi:hypothetical protein|nr:hypothetical protein [Spirochaetaceae bacterium]